MKTDIEYQIKYVDALNLACNTADIFSAQRQIVDSLNVELNHLDQRQREKRAFLVQREQAIVKHQKERDNRLIESQKSQNLVEELQDALDADAIEEGRLETLKEQLAEAEEDAGTYEGSYGEAVIAKDAMFEAMNKTRERMAALDKEINEYEAKVLKAEAKSNQRTSERRVALQEKNAAIEAVDEEKREKARRLEERQNQTVTVEEFIVQANDICPRVAVDEGENQPSLMRKFEKLQRDLRNAEKR